MIYRQFGPTGIKVSVIGYGNWLNSNSQEAQQLTIDCVKTSWDLGINFFDTAESYGNISVIQASGKLRDKLVRLSRPLMFQDITMFSRLKYSSDTLDLFRQQEDSQGSISLKE